MNDIIPGGKWLQTVIETNFIEKGLLGSTAAIFHPSIVRERCVESTVNRGCIRSLSIVLHFGVYLRSRIFLARESATQSRRDLM